MPGTRRKTTPSTRKTGAVVVGVSFVAVIGGVWFYVDSLPGPSSRAHASRPRVSSSPSTPLPEQTQAELPTIHGGASGARLQEMFRDAGWAPTPPNGKDAPTWKRKYFTVSLVQDRRKTWWLDNVVMLTPRSSAMGVKCAGMFTSVKSMVLHVERAADYLQEHPERIFYRRGDTLACMKVSR